jgi:hypothetical protein
MRGPQFEANDVRRGLGYDVQMEAVNNVLFDYERSGSRYTTGIEDHQEEAIGTKFEFQFLSNAYLNPDGSRPEIEAVLKHGVIDSLQVYIAGNRGPHWPPAVSDRLDGVFTDQQQQMEAAPVDVQRQLATRKLFEAPIPVTVEAPTEAYVHVLEEAGCVPRDPVDLRIIHNVRERRFGQTVKSQADVGGWPELESVADTHN